MFLVVWALMLARSSAVESIGDRCKENVETLFEFLGLVIGKAIFEGIAARLQLRQFPPIELPVWLRHAVNAHMVSVAVHKRACIHYPLLESISRSRSPCTVPPHARFKRIPCLRGSCTQRISCSSFWVMTCFSGFRTTSYYPKRRYLGAFG